MQQLRIPLAEATQILIAVYDWKTTHGYPVEPYDYRPPIETLLKKMEVMWKSDLEARDAILSGLMEEVKRLQAVVAQLQTKPEVIQSAKSEYATEYVSEYEGRIPIVSQLWGDPPTVKAVKLTLDETVGELLSKSAKKFATKPEQKDDVYSLVLQFDGKERVLDLIDKPLQIFQSLVKPGVKPPIFLLEIDPVNQSWASVSRPLSDELVSAKQASVLFGYTARAGNELTIQPGQVLSVLKRHGNWVLVERNDKRGWIPLSYVAFDSVDSPEASNLIRSGSTESVRLRRTRSLSDIVASSHSSIDKLDALLGLLGQTEIK
jgi:hypothetical protein